MVAHIDKPEKVVVIAASAGGIPALTQVLSKLAYNLPAAIVLVQHLTADHKTHLHEYLSRRCFLRVCLAKNGLPLEQGVIYVSVPGRHVRPKGGHLVLERGKPVNYVRPSADVLFASAAREYGSKTVGVILTGTGRDGACGCQEIKAKGGVTIAQDEETSSSFGMPKAAIEANAIDYVLPLDEIAGKITDLVRKGVGKKTRKVKEKSRR